MKDDKLLEILAIHIRTRRKKRYIVAIFSLIPVFLSALFVFSSKSISMSNSDDNKLKKQISNQVVKFKEIKKIDTLIVYKTKKVFDVFKCDSAYLELFEYNKSLLELLKDCQENSLKSYLTGNYDCAEISGEFGAFDLKNKKIDLFILRNGSNSEIQNLEIIQPKSISIKEVLYSWTSTCDSIFWSNGSLPKGRYMIFSVEKLKSLKENVVIKYSKASLSDSHAVGQITILTR